MRRLSRLLTPMVFFTIGGLLMIALGPITSPPMDFTADTDVACDSDGVAFTTEVDSTPHTVAVTITGVDAIACDGFKLIVGIGVGQDLSNTDAYFRSQMISGATSYRFPISTAWRDSFDPVTGAIAGNALALPLTVARFQWLSVDAVKTPSPTPPPSPSETSEPTVPTTSPTTPTTSPTTTPTQTGEPTTPTASPTPIPAQTPTATLAPGSGTLVINGVSVPVTVTADPGSTSFTITGAGVTLQVASRTADGQPLALAPDGSLVLSAEGPVTLNATGFAEGSTVTLWIYSAPVLLGVFPVDSRGVAAVSVADLDAIPPGPHTLQVLGKNASGTQVTFNIGVIVADESVLVDGKPRLALSKSRAKPGEVITATARTVRPACRVQFWVKGRTITASANAYGERAVRLRLPTAIGTYKVTLKVLAGPGCTGASALSRYISVRR